MSQCTVHRYTLTSFKQADGQTDREIYVDSANGFKWICIIKVWKNVSITDSFDFLYWFITCAQISNKSTDGWTDKQA